MAVEIQLFSVSVPAGTPIATPQVSSLAMPVRQVDKVEFLVPPGPRGEVGFRLTSGGQQVVPTQLGAWVVTDNEVVGWPLEDQLESGAWQLTAYNTGIFPHTITVRFLVSLPSSLSSSSSSVIPSDQLTSSSSSDTSLPPAPTVPSPTLPPAPTVPSPTLPPAPELPPSPQLGPGPIPSGGGYDVLSPGLKVGLAHIAIKAMYQRDPTAQELVDLANSIGSDGSNFADLVQQLDSNTSHPDLARIDSEHLAARLDAAGIA